MESLENLKELHSLYQLALIDLINRDYLTELDLIRVTYDISNQDFDKAMTLFKKVILSTNSYLFTDDRERVFTHLRYDINRTGILLQYKEILQYSHAFIKDPNTEVLYLDFKSLSTKKKVKRVKAGIDEKTGKQKYINETVYEKSASGEAREFYSSLNHHYYKRDELDKLKIISEKVNIYEVYRYRKTILPYLDEINRSLDLVKQIIKNNNLLEVLDETTVNRMVQAKFSKDGQKGGKKKAENLEPIKQKILAYHDERFTERKENGKFLHSHSETARLIIKHLKIDCYEETSLTNIIAKHRKSHFTP